MLESDPVQSLDSNLRFGLFDYHDTDLEKLKNLQWSVLRLKACMVHHKDVRYKVLLVKEDGNAPFAEIYITA